MSIQGVPLEMSNVIFIVVFSNANFCVSINLKTWPFQSGLRNIDGLVAHRRRATTKICKQSSPFVGWIVACLWTTSPSVG